MSAQSRTVAVLSDSSKLHAFGQRSGARELVSRAAIQYSGLPELPFWPGCANLQPSLTSRAGLFEAEEVDVAADVASDDSRGIYECTASRSAIAGEGG